MYIIGIMLLLIDIISKLVIKSVMNLNSSIVVIKDFFNITYVHNYGAGFSILEGNRILLVIIGFIITILLIMYYINKGKELKKTERIAYWLILGGTIGNLIDRVCYGYVIDFFDFKIFNYNYPVFNVADCGLVIGVIIYIIGSFRSELKWKK